MGRECVFFSAVQSRQGLGLAHFLDFSEHSCFSLVRTAYLAYLGLKASVEWQRSAPLLFFGPGQI